LASQDHWFPGKGRRDADWALSLLSRGLVLAALFLVVYWITSNVTATLNKQNISTGFDFLWRPARIQIGETLIPFSPTDTYGRAILACTLNTLQVGFIGCILATILGVIVGVLRLAENPLIRKVSGLYVEVFRNTPLLLQLFFWYASIQLLPGVRQTYSLFGTVFLNQRGVQLPVLRFNDPYHLTLIAIVATIAVFMLTAGSRPFRERLLLRLAPIAAYALAWAMGAVSFAYEAPKLQGFGFTGGVVMTPEFLALLTGLVVYTATYIAEIVRGGIQAIPSAQIEAAESLGLSRVQTLRLVTLPQTLRIIVPPLVSQYLNLVKNSSLAVAIGYPDLVWAANAVINQTGQSIEGILIIAAVYLTISLLTSFILNSLNERGRMRAAAAGVRQIKAAGGKQTAGFAQTARLLFATPAQAIVSVIGIALSAYVLAKLIGWAVVDAVWTGPSAACRTPEAGACWSYVNDKLNFFLFGLFPQDQLWRPALATAIVIAVAAMTMMPRFWTKWLLAIWLGGAFGFLWLMGGGLGVPYVPTTSWGGVPVTLMLATSSIVIALPISIVLAVARNSKSPSASMIATGWIEIIRGVPLISILFLANTLLPLFLPGGGGVDKLLRAQVALTIFASAYLAEAVRAGLRAVPAAQTEASQSLALSYFQMLRLVILPQALTTALPGIVNTSIGNFKDTTLVAIIGLFDILGTVRAAGRDPNWLGFEIEGYLFAALLYFICCFAMSRYGAWLERRGPKRSPIPAAEPA
jgi:general L-amino acid transport system permease protein